MAVDVHGDSDVGLRVRRCGAEEVVVCDLDVL
jgi:hypothetical protein